MCKAAVFCRCSQGAGGESRAKSSLFDHESDSGLSGSLTDSGRALADDGDTTAAARGSHAAAPPYASFTGSYCPARAADERRSRPATAAPRPPGVIRAGSGGGHRPSSCRTARNVERTMILEMPAHDTYV